MAHAPTVALLFLSIACSAHRVEPPARVFASPPTPLAIPDREGTLPLANMQFVIEGATSAVLFRLDGNSLYVGQHLEGDFSSDGTFVFNHMDQRVTASLTDGGRVVIVASEGPDLPGDLGRLLRSAGGRLESGYVIRPDGTATMARSAPLSFDTEGRLSRGGLVVRGRTPETRRTAMFIYVLQSMVVQ